MDCRAEEGWKNPPGRAFIPVVRALSGLLGDNFPERLQRLVIYPMPSFGMAVWRMCVPFIDSTTAKKVVLLPGSSKRGSPCPTELGQYVAYSELREDRRHRHTALLDAERENAPPNAQH